MQPPQDDPAADAAPTPADVEELREALNTLELVPYSDPASAADPALHLGRVATQWNREDLAMQARLVHADVIGRAGDTAGAGAIAREVNAWAMAQGNAHLQARSERLLSAFYSRVGDMATSLEHAVRAVELLDADARPRLRADHLMALGLALGRCQSYDAARDRFRAVLAIADATDDAQLRLAALNNLAFVEYWAGEPEAALRAANRMQECAARNNFTLEPSFLDTVARAQMMHGQYAEAEATLAPLATSADGDSMPESDALAEILLTVAECQRMTGHTDRAQASLKRATQLCEERGLQEVRVRVIQERAAIAAHEGRYADAYAQHVQFHQASETLYSAEREARARILQAVFETEEAQRSSRRFRELSLRDPLTGLYNRRYVDDRLPALLSASREEATSLALALIDLDHFKRVNDECSHDTGDEVLRRLAPMFELCAIAQGGFAARLGGEEFLVVLPGLDVEAAVAACDTLRITVRDHPWTALVGDIPITMSLVVAACFAGADSPSALLALADQRLYASKHAGRDQVTGW